VSCSLIILGLSANLLSLGITNNKKISSHGTKYTFLVKISSNSALMLYAWRGAERGVHDLVAIESSWEGIKEASNKPQPASTAAEVNSTYNHISYCIKTDSER